MAVNIVRGEIFGDRDCVAVVRHCAPAASVCTNGSLRMPKLDAAGSLVLLVMPCLKVSSIARFTFHLFKNQFLFHIFPGK